MSSHLPYAADGTQEWEVWGIACGIGFVQGVLSFSTPNRRHHRLANPHRPAFHGTIASPSLPETCSTYRVLHELLSGGQRGVTHTYATVANMLSGLTGSIFTRHVHERTYYIGARL